MATSIPNLWEGKISRSVLTPVAILRTQAGNFEAEIGKVLRAEVRSRIQPTESGSVRHHTFDIVAPGLNGYRREVLSAEHADPGAYPVQVRSDFLPTVVHVNQGYVEDQDRTCRNQEHFLKVLGAIFSSERLTTEIESLIAQINDTSDPDADG